MSEKRTAAPADDGSKKAAAAAASSGNKDAAATEPNLDLLEEDDEFEEFPADTWTAADEDGGDAEQLWGDNWDDDDAHFDDFANQLRAELAKKQQTGK